MAPSARVQALSQGDRHLRTAVLFAVGAQAFYLVFLTVFLWRHADPMGDGMEMVCASAAFMLIFLPFTLPAYLLAKRGRWLIVSALLAGLSAVLQFLFWLEILDEIGISRAPWS
jgi:hypothetical protein